MGKFHIDMVSDQHAMKVVSQGRTTLIIAPPSVDYSRRKNFSLHEGQIVERNHQPGAS